jgi:hypothetical protein
MGNNSSPSVPANAQTDLKILAADTCATFHSFDNHTNLGQRRHLGPGSS